MASYWEKQGEMVYERASERLISSRLTPPSDRLGSGGMETEALGQNSQAFEGRGAEYVQRVQSLTPRSLQGVQSMLQEAGV